MTKKKFWMMIFAIAATLCLALDALVIIGNEIVRAADQKVGTLSVSVLKDDSELLINGYLDKYGVPTSEMNFSTDGGEDDNAGLRQAFDRDFSTYWRSQKIEGSKTVGLTVSFKDITEIEGFVYQSEGGARGYFATLKVSYMEAKDENFKVLGTISSTSTSNLVYVGLGKKIQASEIKLEWVQVANNALKVASASELIFLQPKSEEVEKISALFDDYAMLKLKKDVNKEQIEKLRGNETIRRYASYLTVLEPLMTRAEQILDGNISLDPRREMSTDPTADNVITRHGNIASYARSTLKMATFGTNRQSTGISASAGETLTVYVTGDKDDPLPTLRVSQHWGSYSRWISGEYKLRLGKNTIRVPYLNQANFTTNNGEPLPSGGPVYLVNPYLPKEDGTQGNDRQSENVKVYIEGGTPFPLFRKGGDTDAFKSILKDYAASVDEDRLFNEESKAYKLVDVVEVVSDHIVVTVEATKADKVYNDNGMDPQKATENWDDFVRKLLMFDGIVFKDEGDTEEDLKRKLDDVGAKYDPRNEWLNCNIRLAQPYGAAYAGSEHVGIQVGWDEAALTGGPNFGWGYAHELGHMMDIPERLVGECSNNMVSKFNETVIEKTASRGDFADTVAALAPDEHIESFWNTNRGNFIFWWLIESYYPGYWARLENLYRYSDIYKDLSEDEKKLGKMNATEKQVYLSSLVTHTDLSYYFERWDYNLSVSDYVFKADGPNTSPVFKKAMEKAKERGEINNDEQLKFWYLDAAEWWNRYPNAANSELYSKVSDKPEIRSITKSANGYNLIIDSKQYDKDAHLGFEISEKHNGEWKVVGFTYERMFLDTAVYQNGYCPTYKVVAYDRALKRSETSDEKQYAPSSAEDKACKINDVFYGSLHEAVSAAKDGDTITVLKPLYETGIIIDKALTIMTESESNVIYKSGPEPVFIIINDGDKKGKLTLKGTANARIVLDGYGIESSGSLIYSKNGDLTMEYCVLQNNIVKWSNTSVGGALRLEGGANISHCEFKGNSARLGGGAYIENRSGTVASFTDCKFFDNEAGEGAGVYNTCTVQLTSCTFENNKATSVGGGLVNLSGGIVRSKDTTFTGNSAKQGGAMYLDGHSTVSGGTIKNNTATEQGGAIYYRTNVRVRALTVEQSDNNVVTVISGNTCTEGAAVYLSGEVSAFKADVKDNSSKYAFVIGGNIKITGGTIKGDLFKLDGSSLTMEKLPTLVDEIYIYTDAADPNCPLLTSGEVISDDFVNKLKVKEGEVVRGDNRREIRLKLKTFLVTFNYGDKVEQRHFLPGQTLVLEGFGGDTSQETYVGKWTCGGVDYNIGEKIEIKSDMTFVGTVSKKYKIEFRVKEDAGAKFNSTIYVMPREKYSLPKIEVEGYLLNGWEHNEKLYQPYLTLSALQDRVYVAKLALKFEVRFYIRKLSAESSDEDMLMFASRYYGFGSRINYEVYDDPDEQYIPYGGFIQGYRILYADGTLSDELLDFNTYTVTSDLKLVAKVIENSSIIIYSIFEKSTNGGSDKFYDEDNPTVVEYAEMGSSYTVALSSVPAGYHIASLDLDGVGYSEDELDGLELKLTMPYYLVNIYLEKNIYNVNYKYNGTYFKTETKRFNDKLVFSDPTDTLLREAFKKRPEVKNYHFTSYELLMTDPNAEDGEGTVAINIRLDDEMVITEDVTINIVVYIEGQESTPSRPDDEDDTVVKWRAQYKQQAQTLADTLVSEISSKSFTLTQIQQEEYVGMINSKLATVCAEIEKRVTPNEMSDLVERLKGELEEIKAEALLWSLKNAAVAKIERARDEALKAFKDRPEYEKVKQEIDLIVDSAVSSIRSAVDPAPFDRTVKDAEEKIELIVALYNGDPLTSQKEQASGAVQTIAASAKSTIKGLSYLTNKRKDALCVVIDNVSESAIQKVNAVTMEGRTPKDLALAQQKINSIQSDFQVEVNEITGSATAENNIKSDAISSIEDIASNSKDAVRKASTDGCEEVELDGLILNGSEIKTAVSELATQFIERIDKLLETAKNEISAIDENEKLNTETETVRQKYETDIKALAVSAADEIEKLIGVAETASREDAITHEVEPLTESARGKVEALELENNAEYFKRVLDAEDRAKKAVLAAENREQIDKALEALKTELAEAVDAATLESEKQAARSKIQYDGETAAHKVDMLEHLSDEAKQNFKASIEEAKNKALTAVEDAADKDDIVFALNVFTQAVEEAIRSAESSDEDAKQAMLLEAAKENARTQIDEMLNGAKAKLGSMGFFEQAEKDERTSQYEGMASEAKRSIEQAEDVATVEGAMSKLTSDFSSKEQETEAEHALKAEKIKKEAKAAVESAVQAAMSAMTQLAFLTREALDEFEARLNKTAEDARSSIESAISIAQVQNARESAETAFAQIKSDAEAADDEAEAQMLLENAKSTALANAIRAANELKAKIAAFEFLTEAERVEFESRVERALESAQSIIRGADSKDEVSDRYADFISIAEGLESEAVQSESIARSNTLSLKSSQISSYADELEQKIDDAGFIDDEEKNALKEQLANAKRQSLAKLNDAKTLKEAEDAVDEMGGAVESLDMSTTTENELNEANLKQSSRSSILEASKVTENIRALGFLPYDEKNGYALQVENARDEALEAVENASTADAVNSVLNQFIETSENIALTAYDKNTENRNIVIGEALSEISDLYQNTLNDLDALELDDTQASEHKNAIRTHFDDASKKINNAANESDAHRYSEEFIQNISSVYEAALRNSDENKARIRMITIIIVLACVCIATAIAVVPIIVIKKKNKRTSTANK